MSTDVREIPPDLSPKALRLATFLHDEATSTTGDLYVKSKFISDDVGLSPKEIGALMGHIGDGVLGLHIEQWSYTSATTWRVTVDS